MYFNKIKVSEVNGLRLKKIAAVLVCYFPNIE